jgi:hypothetical protein
MKTETKKTSKKTITFYSLLEKYDGDIKKAKLSELQKVRPNGMKALFEAWRVYSKFHPEQAKTHLTKGALKQ